MTPAVVRVETTTRGIELTNRAQSWSGAHHN